MTTKHGWAYLTVDANDQGAFSASDGGKFTDEREMFDQLGKTGWELITILTFGNNTRRYYFKRMRT
jgi:hypothetical protein